MTRAGDQGHHALSEPRLGHVGSVGRQRTLTDTEVTAQPVSQARNRAHRPP